MQPEQKIVIDVNALFERLIDVYKWIAWDNAGLRAFCNKPELYGDLYSNTGGDVYTIGQSKFAGSVKPQLFERPKPSAWKLIADCNLSDDIFILWRIVNRDGFAGETHIGRVSQARSMSNALIRSQIKWCEIPE